MKFDELKRTSAETADFIIGETARTAEDISDRVAGSVSEADTAVCRGSGRQDGNFPRRACRGIRMDRRDRGVYAARFCGVLLRVDGFRCVDYCCFRAVYSAGGALFARV